MKGESNFMLGAREGGEGSPPVDVCVLGGAHGGFSLADEPDDDGGGDVRRDDHEPNQQVPGYATVGISRARRTGRGGGRQEERSRERGGSCESARGHQGSLRQAPSAMRTKA